MLKTFKDGSWLEFGKGKFDDWCIYYHKPDGSTSFPLDSQYFQCLQNIGRDYKYNNVYADFLTIYNRTTKDIDDNVFQLIRLLSVNYGKWTLVYDVIMSIIYMGMVAEENKEHSVLGKRIKRLGIYLTLIKREDVMHSANFMRGMKWRELDEICKGYGF